MAERRELAHGCAIERKGVQVQCLMQEGA